MSEVSLFRDELEDIHKIMKKFPEAEKVDIIVDDSNGIGKLTDIVIPATINGVSGDLKISITNVENW